MILLMKKKHEYVKMSCMKLVFFQGIYGRNFVILLHEEGVNIPTNLSGVAYVSFPKDSIETSFHVLQRELKAIYKL